MRTVAAHPARTGPKSTTIADITTRTHERLMSPLRSVEGVDVNHRPPITLGNSGTCLQLRTLDRVRLQDSRSGPGKEWRLTDDPHRGHTVRHEPIRHRCARPCRIGMSAEVVQPAIRLPLPSRRHLDETNCGRLDRPPSPNALNPARFMPLKTALRRRAARCRATAAPPCGRTRWRRARTPALPARTTTCPRPVR